MNVITEDDNKITTYIIMFSHAIIFVFLTTKKTANRKVSIKKAVIISSFNDSKDMYSIKPKYFDKISSTIFINVVTNNINTAKTYLERTNSFLVIGKLQMNLS